LHKETCLPTLPNILIAFFCRQKIFLLSGSPPHRVSPSSKSVKTEITPKCRYSYTELHSVTSLHWGPQTALEHFCS
jgi:hypothetical protein